MENQDKTKAIVQGANANGPKEAQVKSINKNLPPAQQKALDLAQTIQHVLGLSKLIKHRDLFETYRDNLIAFEVKGNDDDIDDKSVYMSCTLKINDGSGRSFEIKSPSVIRATVEFLHKQFDVKLKETEAKIKLPINTAA